MSYAFAATRLLLIRHGETDWNVARRVQGHADIPLNARGRQQAERLAQALTDSPIHHVYSSDLQRALQTAHAIAAVHGAPVCATVDLRERHFGEIEGLDFLGFEQRHPDAAWHWRKRTPDWQPPGGGESLQMLRERVVKAVHDIGSRHHGEQVAIVSHGGVLDVLYRAAARLDLQAARTWELSNCAINRLLWTPGGLILVGWGDMSHLEPV